MRRKDYRNEKKRKDAPDKSLGYEGKKFRNLNSRRNRGGTGLREKSPQKYGKSRGTKEFVGKEKRNANIKKAKQKKETRKTSSPGKKRKGKP